MQCPHKEGKSLLEEFQVPAGVIWANKGDFGKEDHFLISISSTLRVTPSLPVGKGVIAPKWHNVRQYLSPLTLSDSANSCKVP